VWFQVHTAAIMKITVFWDVSCGLVETDRCFRGAYCLQLHLWNISHFLRDSHLQPFTYFKTALNSVRREVLYNLNLVYKWN
jgi:hypothetical protein